MLCVWAEIRASTSHVLIVKSRWGGNLVCLCNLVCLGALILNEGIQGLRNSRDRADMQLCQKDLCGPMRPILMRSPLKYAVSSAAQVQGFSRAQFKGFSSKHEAQVYLQGGTALHSLQPSSRPQTKRRHTAGPAWQGAVLQQYGMPQPAQLPYQYSTGAAAASSEEQPVTSGDEDPHCSNMLCHPAQLYRLVSNAHTTSL